MKIRNKNPKFFGYLYGSLKYLSFIPQLWSKFTQNIAILCNFDRKSKFFLRKSFFSIFVQNFNFSPKVIVAHNLQIIHFSTKFRLFSKKIPLYSKILIVFQNFDCFPTFRLFSKILIVFLNFDCFPQIISIFAQNFDFFPKNFYLCTEFRFCPKKFLFLSKILIFFLNFDCFPKFYCFPKFRLFPKF